MPEATLLGGDHDTHAHILTANAASGEVIKLADDRAAVVTGLDAANALTSGKTTDVVVRGPVRLAKASGTDLTGEKRIFWDVSGNLAIAGAGASGDFDAGGFIGGGAVGQTYVDVDLNSKAGVVTA